MKIRKVQYCTNAEHKPHLCINLSPLPLLKRERECFSPFTAAKPILVAFIIFGKYIMDIGMVANDRVHNDM